MPLIESPNDPEKPVGIRISLHIVPRDDMEARSRNLVSLPVRDPTQSCWQDPPADIASFCSSELPTEADVVIIGSGITGTAVAWNLLGVDGQEPTGAQPERPAPRVVMLEARGACSGATGRNGGHTKAASYRSFLRHAEMLGTEDACRIARLELATLRAIHKFAADHRIHCESKPCQTVDVFYDVSQWRQAHDAVDAMRRAMPGEDASKYTFCSPQVLKDKYHVGGEGVYGGLEYEAGSISAYLFTIGVLRLCLERGLNLQTHTPAINVERKGGQGEPEETWTVETPAGSIVTKKVVLATNGYTAFLRPDFQGLIVPTRGQMTAQRPGSSMPQEGLSTTYSFIYDTGFEYMISRPRSSPRSGNIMMGGGLFTTPDRGVSEQGTTDDSILNPSISAYLYATTARYFGANWGDDHSDGRIRREWTGIMGFSPDGLPFVGEVPGELNLWIAAGFQGHGMVFCWKCAEALTAIMRGDDGEQLKAWFPEGFLVNEGRMSRA